MEIYNQINKVSDIDQKQARPVDRKKERAERSEQKADVRKGESVELSQGARMAQQGNKILTELADSAREARIAEARQKAQSGYYNNPEIYKKIADKLLGL